MNTSPVCLSLGWDNKIISIVPIIQQQFGLEPGKKVIHITQLMTYLFLQYIHILIFVKIVIKKRKKEKICQKIK